METQQNEIIKKVEPLINSFCKIILTDSDCLNHKQAEEHIDSLKDSDKRNLNTIKNDNDKEICSIVLIQIMGYLQGFQTGDAKVKVGSPFQFDSGGSFRLYRKHFESYYATQNNNHTIPYVYEVIFDYIQETSDHYRIFEQFYAVRAIETTDAILSKTQTQAENAVKIGVEKAAEEAAQKAAESAVRKVNKVTQEVVSKASNKAEAFAQAASESAKNAMKEASAAAKTAAEEETKKVIDLKMTEVTKHISESSVTILGIFSGIVLTVVAGLFYSSSVLESVQNANFYRLMFIAALIGLVCFGLIVVMFRFIEKISGKSEVDFLSDTMVKIITVILCIVMVFGFVLQLTSSRDKNNNIEESSITMGLTEEYPTKELVTKEISTINSITEESITK